ncbi:YlxM family DNA-binding protein [Schnuerera ultunensis]|uniref:UPF0122 protein CUESP1_1625 n=1 Tax=[Clostridium] ultunense Esp TaxID=1288971 RepID=A0A1M4PNG0_9FIRM|nr:sigma factor-like helix-turn-helix DNA-binding protein [Schnuerera ultunensis]SHD76988.1 putative helix-turn-helix protein, YlxM/p13-like protein [[Clostridium] ultunense Esp]
MFERIVEVGILFDFYGKLLSERQFTAIELYYVHDLSLAEIGEELGISRQSVYDTLKRAEENLYEYEKTLGLVRKFKYNREEIDKLFKLMDDMEIEARNIDNLIMQKKVKDLKETITKIIDNNQEVVN